MSDIRVKMKNGKTKLFKDEGAPGGSYCNHLKYEGTFAVIEDPYGKVTAIPAEDIEEIEHDSSRRNF